MVAVDELAVNEVDAVDGLNTIVENENDQPKELECPVPSIAEIVLKDTEVKS